MKLLIVDDSVLMQDRIKTIIDEKDGINLIGQAYNSFQAYELFNLHEPDIIILDIRLPGDNGITMLERFKKLNESTKIIILTNYPFQQYEKKCRDLGADYFLDKSNDFDTLYDVLAEITKLI